MDIADISLKYFLIRDLRQRVGMLIYNSIEPLLKWLIAMNQYLIPNTERLVNKIYLHVCFERGSFLIIAIDVCVDLRIQIIIGPGHQIS